MAVSVLTLVAPSRFLDSTIMGMFLMMVSGWSLHLLGLVYKFMVSDDVLKKPSSATPLAQNMPVAFSQVFKY